MRPLIDAWSRDDVIPLDPRECALEAGPSREFTDPSVSEPRVKQPLVVGIGGVVPHPRAPGGFYAGSSDAASFRELDYESRDAFDQAVADAIGRLAQAMGRGGVRPSGRRLNEQHKAQFARLSQEIWYRAHEKQRVMREGIPSIAINVVPRHLNHGITSSILRLTFTTPGGEVEELEQYFGASNPMALSAVIDRVLRAQWTARVDESLKEVALEFAKEAGLEDFRVGSSGVGDTLRFHRESKSNWASYDARSIIEACIAESPVIRRMKASWRSGYRMVELGAAIKGAYSEVDREVISMAAALSSSLTYALYLDMMGCKAECRDALQHGGLAVFHLPPRVVPQLHGGRDLHDDHLEVCKSFMARLHGGLSDRAREVLGATSPRLLSVLVSRTMNSASPTDEAADRAAAFLNLCAIDGFAPSYTLLCQSKFLMRVIDGDWASYAADPDFSYPAASTPSQPAAIDDDVVFAQARRLYVAAKAVRILTNGGEKASPAVASVLSADIEPGDDPEAVAGAAKPRSLSASVFVEGRPVMVAARRLGVDGPLSGGGELSLLKIVPRGEGEFVSDGSALGSMRGRGALVFAYRPKGARKSEHVYWPIAGANERSAALKVWVHVANELHRYMKPLGEAAMAVLAPRIDAALERVRRDDPLLLACLSNGASLTKGEAIPAGPSKKLRPWRDLAPYFRMALATKSVDGVAAVMAACRDPLEPIGRGRSVMDLAVTYGTEEQIRVVGSFLRARVPGLPGSFFHGAVEEALDQYSPTKLMALMALRPSMTPHQVSRYERFHRSQRTPELTAEVMGCLMRETLRTTSGAEGPVVQPEAPRPPSPRRVIAL